MKLGDKVSPIVNGEPVTSVVGTVYGAEISTSVGGRGTCVPVLWPWSGRSAELEMCRVGDLHLIEPPFVLERGDICEYSRSCGETDVFFVQEPYMDKEPQSAVAHPLRVLRKDPNDPNIIRCVWQREEQP